MCWFTKSQTSTKILLSFVKDLSEVIRGVAAKLKYNFAKKLFLYLNSERFYFLCSVSLNTFYLLAGKLVKHFWYEKSFRNYYIASFFTFNLIV